MLARVFGCCRVVFNDALRVRDDAYRSGVKLSDSEIQRRVITEAKTTTDRAWLREVPSVALVQSVNDSRRAWRNFFDSANGKRKGCKVGRPRMKSRKDHRQSFRLTRNGFSVRGDGRLFLAKVGEVRVRWSRAVPSEPSSVTIIREPDGHYYASFVVDVPTSPLPGVDRQAGVDVGIARLATVATSDGARVDVANPKHLGRKLRQLGRLEREKSRRQKGSANREKSRRKIAVVHIEVARARRDYHHKQALALVRENQVIHVEDLNIVGMVKNRQLPSNFGCRVEPVRPDHRREGKPLRAHRAPGVALVGIQQDMFGLRAPARRNPATGTAVDVPGLPSRPRQRPQCRQSHSRRRSGGETKRLPRMWVGLRKWFRWSPCKTATHCGGGR